MSLPLHFHLPNSFSDVIYFWKFSSLIQFLEEKENQIIPLSGSHSSLHTRPIGPSAMHSVCSYEVCFSAWELEVLKDGNLYIQLSIHRFWIKINGSIYVIIMTWPELKSDTHRLFIPLVRTQHWGPTHCKGRLENDVFPYLLGRWG